MICVSHGTFNTNLTIIHLITLEVCTELEHALAWVFLHWRPKSFTIGTIGAKAVYLPIKATLVTSEGHQNTAIV